jgi:transposase
MGRSRGGLTSKLHALVDAGGRPVTLHLTAGQIGDCQEAEALIETVCEGDIVLGDKGYATNAIRAKLAEKKAWANIPPRSNRKVSFVFSKWVYRQRNFVERFFNRIKQFRGIATRLRQRSSQLLCCRQIRGSQGMVLEFMSPLPRCTRSSRDLAIGGNVCRCPPRNYQQL